MDKCIVLFSGGKDSFLTACKSIEKGYFTYLVNYENGFGLNGENSNHGAKRILEKYGKEHCEIIGVKDISGIMRQFMIPLLNNKPSEILKNYGELTQSQMHCTICRVSMYIFTILLCKKYDVKNVMDGARISQKFAIELPEVYCNFIELFNIYNINLMFPMSNWESDWNLKNKLLIRGFVPKVLEPQCLLGMPLENRLTQDEINAVISFYKKYVEEKAKEIIDEMLESPITDIIGSKIM